MKNLEKEIQQVVAGEMLPSELLDTYCDENGLCEDDLRDCAVECASFNDTDAACECLDNAIIDESHLRDALSFLQERAARRKNE